MFGFSFGEIIVISTVALLVLGPERIPHVARSLGRLFAELRRATDEVKREFNYSEFTRNNPPINLNLPSSSGLRTASVITENSIIDHPPIEEPVVEPEQALNCEEKAKLDTPKE
jgi:Tat protein translocase TatB subunit